MTTSGWDYHEAFSRNLGLISPEEQEKLRGCRIAIPGMGGVGGIHLITLARLGIGKFRIADPDEYEVANFNRQFGATVDALGLPKADVMVERARQVNPELEIEGWQSKVDEQNIDDFLQDVDVLLDSVDFFSFKARRMLFNEARKRGIWTVTAGPIGFSTAWLCFDPNGMSYDRYFDVNDNMSDLEHFSALATGLAPKATHFRYIDLNYVKADGRAPSLGLACQLASGVAAAEIAKILTGKTDLVRSAPCFQQFDAYRCLLRKGRLWGGNRHPLQRVKAKTAPASFVGPRIHRFIGFLAPNLHTCHWCVAGCLAPSILCCIPKKEAVPEAPLRNDDRTNFGQTSSFCCDGFGDDQKPAGQGHPSPRSLHLKVQERPSR